MSDLSKLFGEKKEPLKIKELPQEVIMFLKYEKLISNDSDLEKTLRDVINFEERFEGYDFWEHVENQIYDLFLEMYPVVINEKGI